jgi:hypothetical protein
MDPEGSRLGQQIEQPVEGRFKRTLIIRASIRGRQCPGKTNFALGEADNK